jgi:tRNA G18 (ribose-2'-O)-methylase SpoU
MFEKKSMTELNRIAKEAYTHHINNEIILILDDVRSMHNVGSAFRTADGFGIKAIYLVGFTPTPPHRDIHKTALGATETVPWKHFETIGAAIQAAKEEQFEIIAVEQTHNSTALNTYTYKQEKIALIFGNEVAGVSDAALNLASACIEIPQYGSKHSFNISVSIGIVLWELLRNN